jgi:predicted phage-related endonuclease
VFGASRAGAIMENPLEEFLLQTRRKPPIEQSEDMEVGSLMEPVVLEMYVRRSGNCIKTGLPLHFHGEYSFMAATPDAIGFPRANPLVDSHDPKAFLPMEWGVDAKTSTDRMFLKDATAEDTNKYGQEGTDLVPDYTLWQMQQQCAVFGFQFVDVPVLFGRHYRGYRVHRDETLIDALVSAEKELAERILADDPPEPNFQHPRTRECLRALYGLQQGTSIVLSDENFERWVGVQRRKQEVKDLEAEIAEATNHVLAEMADAELAIMPAGSKAIKRIVVKDSLWAQKDIDEAVAKLGTTKRAGHEQLREVKVTN